MMKAEATSLSERLQNYSTTSILVTQSTCTRCGGLMVNEICLDLWNSASELECNARRCVQCGDVVDAVILRNRRVGQVVKALPSTATPVSSRKLNAGLRKDRMSVTGSLS